MLNKFCAFVVIATYTHTDTQVPRLHTCLILLQHILFLTYNFYIYTYGIYKYIIYIYIYIIYIYIYNVYIKKKEVSYTIEIQYVNLKC